MPQDANEVHAQLMFDYLTKEADDGPGTEAVTEGENPYSVEGEGTEQRPKDSIDAPWGEPDTPNPKEPGQVAPLSKEVLQAIQQGREGLLGKLIAGKEKSDKADQELIRQHFSGSYETSSPQLSGARGAESLVDRIRQVAGRH
jgi:hypothetical protein